MTETTSQPIEPEAAQQPSNAFIDGAVQFYNATVTEHNELTAKFRALRNADATVTELYDTSDDEKVAQIRKFVEEQQAAINEAIETARSYIQTNLLPSTESFDQEAAKTRQAELAEQAKAATSLLQVQGYDVSTLPELDKLRKSRSTNSNGSDTKNTRPRMVAAWVDGTPVNKTKDDGTTVTNFTLITQYLNSLNDGTKYDMATVKSHAETNGFDPNSNTPIEFAVGKHVVKVQGKQSTTEAAQQTA